MSRSITVDNSDLKRWTGKITSRLRDLRAPILATKNYMEAKIKHQFETETDPDGNPWEPLKEETLKQKKGQGSILIAPPPFGGKLPNSFLYDISNHSLKISNTSPVFEAHNEGILPQPERKILGISAEDKNRIAGLVKGYVRGSR